MAKSIKTIFILSFVIGAYQNCGEEGKLTGRVVAGSSNNDQSSLYVSPPPPPPPPVLPPFGIAGQIYANRADSGIVVDGNLDDAAWSTTRSVIFSNPKRSDNITEAKILWNMQSIFLSYKITDTKLETQTGAVHLDDAVEFFFDTKFNRAVPYDADDAHVIVSIGGRVYADGLLNVPSVSLAVVSNPGVGATFEIAIPWAVLKTTPINGLKMGLLLGNDDRDSGVVGTYDWMGIIDTVGSYYTPSQWGTLTLWQEP